MKLDKYKSQHNQWRISEKSFFAVSLIGGSLGCWMGMYMFHHKTKKWYFIIGIPLILIIQIIVYIYFKNI